MQGPSGVFVLKELRARVVGKAMEDEAGPLDGKESWGIAATREAE